MLLDYVTDIINEDVVLMPGLKFFEEPVKKENRTTHVHRNQWIFSYSI